VNLGKYPDAPDDQRLRQVLVYVHVEALYGKRAIDCRDEYGMKCDDNYDRLLHAVWIELCGVSAGVSIVHIIFTQPRSGYVLSNTFTNHPFPLHIAFAKLHMPFDGCRQIHGRLLTNVAHTIRIRHHALHKHTTVER
jgi:hypothetical protein